MSFGVLGNLSLIVLLAGCATSQKNICACCEDGASIVSAKAVVQDGESAVTFLNDEGVYQ